MADFFDITKPEDYYLLHSSVRDHTEAGTVANKVEWEVLDAFKFRDMQQRSNWDAFFEYESGADPNEVIKVRLVGYDAETPSESNADLKEALRRTIAEVVEWVLLGYNQTSEVKSESLGRWSATYGSVPSYKDFPAGWKNKLKNFDASWETYSV